jgi:hypothetical protein
MDPQMSSISNEQRMVGGLTRDFRVVAMPLVSNDPVYRIAGSKSRLTILSHIGSE